MTVLIGVVGFSKEYYMGLGLIQHYNLRAFPICFIEFKQHNRVIVKLT